MRTVSIRLCDMERTCIPIGFVGENLYTRVRIDSKVVFDEYPTAIASLTVQDPNGSMYPGFISRDGDVIIWDVTASDLVYGGNGALQLAFFVDDVIAKSYICRTYVSKAMIGPGTIPTPIASWIDAANVVLGEAEEVFEALDNMTVAAETLAAGSTATVEISDVDGHKHIDFGIPKGDQGEQGEKGDTGAAGRDGTDGADGFSPTLVVTTITGGHRITITDKVGTQTVDVLDGEKGETGATGNGIASVVLNQDYTLTITYTNGNSYTTTSIRGEKGETGATGQTGATGATPIISIGTVTTGAPGSEASATMDTTDPAHPVLSMSIPEGEPGDATIDDTSTAADRVWSAQKVNELKSAITQEKAPVILDTASGEIVTIPDGADGMAVETLTVAIEPVQDLHGQANPYPGGGSKNKLPLTLDALKAENTPSAWSGNTFHHFTVNTVDGNVESISVNAPASSGNTMQLTFTLPAGTYYLDSGFTESQGLNDTYIQKNGTTIARGNAQSPGRTFTLTEESELIFYIRYYANAQGGVSYKAYPMVCLNSESDKSYVPYSNLCPISGWTGANVARTGKNLAPKGESGSKHSITFTVASDGKVTTSGTAGGSSSYVLGEVKLFANTQYVLSGCASGGGQGKYGLGLLSYDESTALATDFGSGETYTPTSDITAKVAIRYWYGQEVSGVFAPQLEIGSAPSAYVAYSGQTKTYTFPAGAGTVYGGTLTVNADGTGKLVVDRCGVTVGNLTKNGDLYAINDAVCQRYHLTVLAPVVAYNVFRDDISSFAISHSAYWGSYRQPSENIGNDNRLFAINGSGDYLAIYDKDKTLSQSDFDSKYATATVVYHIATPVTYTLTDLEVIELLKGVNNLWADCGNVSIEYPCDTKLYVDKKIMQAIANALNA